MGQKNRRTGRRLQRKLSVGAQTRAVASESSFQSICCRQLCASSDFRMHHCSTAPAESEIQSSFGDRQISGQKAQRSHADRGSALFVRMAHSIPVLCAVLCVCVSELTASRISPLERAPRADIESRHSEQQLTGMKTHRMSVGTSYQCAQCRFPVPISLADLAAVAAVASPPRWPSPARRWRPTWQGAE
jgi:hypothetical protein